MPPNGWLGLQFCSNLPNWNSVGELPHRNAVACFGGNEHSAVFDFIDRPYIPLPRTSSSGGDTLVNQFAYRVLNAFSGGKVE